VEKLITVTENSQKHSATNTHLVSSRKLSLENHVTQAVNAESLLAKVTASVIIGGFALVKSLMSVGNVGNPLGRALASFSTGEFTLEYDLTNVRSIGSYLATSQTSLNINEFTLEKGLMSAAICAPTRLFTLEKGLSREVNVKISFFIIPV
jgi:hypothetical protein